MSANYYIQWKSSVGIRKAILAGAGSGQGDTGVTYFTRLAYRKELNAPGWFRIDVPAQLPAHIGISDRDQVEIYRRDKDAGIAWAVDCHGIFRDEAIVDDRATGHETFQASGPGALARLSSYHVLWPANTANRTSFASIPAETILKTLVSYNAVSALATVANGRDRTAPDYGISVQTDTTSGAVLTLVTGERKNLLSVLQDMQPLTGGDFDLIKIAANSWQFRFYPGQRGTDRRSTLLFSKRLGNMANVRYERMRSRERTVTAVAGQGEEAARRVVIRTGPNYSAWNDSEMLVNATDIKPGASETAQLNAKGDTVLKDIASRAVFAFDILQTQSCRYGRDFFLGDLAQAYHPWIGTIDIQITAIEVEYTPGDGEQLTVEVAIR